VHEADNPLSGDITATAGPGSLPPLGPSEGSVCGPSAVPAGITSAGEDRAKGVPAPDRLPTPLEPPSCFDDPLFCPEPGNAAREQEGSGAGTFCVPAEARNLP
jgi:hypothetical protein